ncbi:MAG TPA: hypothetical protein VKV26_14485 [Dehalococcoidia bacterium]|nr:hypothetical protein [Dehalococcoidia bacterium]
MQRIHQRSGRLRNLDQPPCRVFGRHWLVEHQSDRVCAQAIVDQALMPAIVGHGCLDRLGRDIEVARQLGNADVGLLEFARDRPDRDRVALQTSFILAAFMRIGLDPARSVRRRTWFGS